MYVHKLATVFEQLTICMLMAVALRKHMSSQILGHICLAYLRISAFLSHPYGVGSADERKRAAEVAGTAGRRRVSGRTSAGRAVPARWVR